MHDEEREEECGMALTGKRIKIMYSIKLYQRSLAEVMAEEEAGSKVCRRG